MNNMTKKQKITIAAMAVVGVLLAAWMLMPRHGEESHENHDDHGSEAVAPHKDDHGAEEKPEKIALDDAQIKAAGIAVAAAAPADISIAITLPGEIRFNEDRTAHVVPKPVSYTHLTLPTILLV